MEKETKTSGKSGQRAKTSAGHKTAASKPTGKTVRKAPVKPVKIERKGVPKTAAGVYALHASSPLNEKIKIIREGLPYTAIDKLSKRLGTSVKSILPIFEMPQTTYNLRKKNGELLGRRDSEMVLYLNELIEYGIEVFDNEEEKFQHWISRPNLSLGGVTPNSLLDSMTGIREVKGCLDRIEYGNMA